MKLTSNVVANVAGSAAVEIGRSRVVCSIRGPLQLTSEYRGTKGKVQCYVTFAPFCKPGGPRMDPRAARAGGASPEREIAFILDGICEQVVVLESFPQLFYEVSLCVLGSDDATDLPALVTAVCASMTNAGIELRDLFALSTAALLPSTSGDAEHGSNAGLIVVNPTSQQLRSSLASCTVAAESSSGSGGTSQKPLYVNFAGGAPVETIGELMAAAIDGCKAQRAALVEQLA